jgi:hypothetical protein
VRGGYAKGSVVGEDLGEEERAEGEEEGFRAVEDCQR